MRNITMIMKELADYVEMKEELEAQISSLQDEVKAYMTDNNTDEVLTPAGKATWRENISSRFDSTRFKKDFADIYKVYCKATTYKRFTFNR